MSEFDLADEDRALRDIWKVEEGGKEVVDDTVGSSRKWACPLLPRGVTLIKR